MANAVNEEVCGRREEKASSSYDHRRTSDGESGFFFSQAQLGFAFRLQLRHRVLIRRSGHLQTYKERLGSYELRLVRGWWVGIVLSTSLSLSAHFSPLSLKRLQRSHNHATQCQLNRNKEGEVILMLTIRILRRHNPYDKG